MISGVPCVGKTTTAYNIIKHFPEFRRVSELDIIRTVVRSVIKNLESENNISPQIIHNKYCALFESLSEKDFQIAKLQSMELIPYVKEIVNRQQMRNIPTIIEGASIIPSTYFNNNVPIEGFEKHIIFINMYLSDLNEHIHRRTNRCKEREYSHTENIIQDEIKIIRNSKNLILHEETLALSKKVNNVFSIDVAHMNQMSILNNIQKIIEMYLMLDF